MICGSGEPGLDGVVREFTVATFVVHAGRVLLLWHPKHAMWLPPGGHIEPGELPDEAAVREVLEETGVRVRLIGAPGLDVAYPRQLLVPRGVQIENIKPGVQHIDLIYFAVPVDDAIDVSGHEALRDRAGWYDVAALEALGANAEIRGWVAQAAATVP